MPACLTAYVRLSLSVRGCTLMRNFFVEGLLLEVLATVKRRSMYLLVRIRRRSTRLLRVVSCEGGQPIELQPTQTQTTQV